MKLEYKNNYRRGDIVFAVSRGHFNQYIEMPIIGIIDEVKAEGITFQWSISLWHTTTKDRHWYNYRPRFSTGSGVYESCVWHCSGNFFRGKVKKEINWSSEYFNPIYYFSILADEHYRAAMRDIAVKISERPVQDGWF